MGGDYPPLLTEGMDYLKWKREVGIWKIGTSLAGTKQAAVCVLRINDFKARDFATRLDVEKLKEAAGLDYLLKELDTYFKEDNTQSVFLAIEELESFMRPQDMNMAEYIAEFKRRLNRIQELFGDNKEMYHDGMLAYRLLTQANLNKEQQTLIKAAMGTQQLTSSAIEECLKRCFGDAVIGGRPREASGHSSDTMKIKVESDVHYHSQATQSPFDENRNTDSVDESHEHAFYQRQAGYRGRGRRNQFSRDGYRSFPKGKQYTSAGKKSTEDEMNAVDRRTGEVLRCRICDSKFHFARECAHRTDSDRSDRC